MSECRVCHVVTIGGDPICGICERAEFVHRIKDLEAESWRNGGCVDCPAEAENKKLKADIQCMVEKAADKSLEGYRELGDKLAASESVAEISLYRANSAERESVRLRKALTEITNSVLGSKMRLIAEQALREVI